MVFIFKTRTIAYEKKKLKVIAKIFNRLLALQMLFIFKSLLLAILAGKLFPYFVICTTGQRISLGATKVIPKQSCELAIGN